MAMATVKLFTQDGETYREFNEAEYKQSTIDKAEAKKQEATATAKADARTSALAKLSALGLTPQEIEAL